MMTAAIMLIVALALLSWPLLEERAKRKREERLAALRRQRRNMELHMYALCEDRDYLTRVLLADLRAVWAERTVEEWLSNDR